MNGRFALLISISCAAALAACGEQPQQEARSETDPASTSQPVADQMGQHFEQVGIMHEAIIRGDLAAVREPAQRMAEHDTVEGMPEGWEPYVDDMRSGARITGEARTFSAAAQSTAAMMKNCGACHKAVDANPRIPQLGALGIPPAEEIGTVPHMLRHKWAADQMWMGLVEPSDDNWAKGVEVLADAPLEPQRMTDDVKVSTEAGRLAQRVHEIGAKAQVVAELDSRAIVYGEFLATCAGCHQILGMGPR